MRIDFSFLYSHRVADRTRNNSWLALLWWSSLLSALLISSMKTPTRMYPSSVAFLFGLITRKPWVPSLLTQILALCVGVAFRLFWVLRIAIGILSRRSYLFYLIWSFPVVHLPKFKIEVVCVHCCFCCFLAEKLFTTEREREKDWMDFTLSLLAARLYPIRLSLFRNSCWLIISLTFEALNSSSILVSRFIIRLFETKKSPPHKQLFFYVILDSIFVITSAVLRRSR